MKQVLDSDWLDERLRTVGGNRTGIAKLLGTSGKGVDRSQVTRLVNGARKLKDREVGPVATYLKCSVEDVARWAGLSPDAARYGFGEMKPAQFEPTPSEGKAKPAPQDKGRHPIFGIWKGKVTLLPDYDYTQPADPDWGKVYDD
ncbi:MAG: hypothetical protein EON59_16055 [Alphaproteobacteria bacterium]|nr:MAG: hypothetical protein EON59_16055 [Alphaproteobacteria bacterium]